MRDGLFKVDFRTPRGAGAGVVVIQNGHVRGGDSMMVYVGAISQHGDQFTSQIEAKVHSRPPKIHSVFGIDHVHIKLAGTTKGDAAQGTGTAAEAPSVSFQGSLTQLGD
jgi:T3SS negative regulator,GrlR